MTDVAVIGAGRIGATIAELLAEAGGYAVTLIDRCEKQLAPFKGSNAVTPRLLDIEDSDRLSTALAGSFAAINAAPYFLTTRIAAAAGRAGVHYLDLTEDVASTRAVRELARQAGRAFIPQCGLAPGFISIVAQEIASRFEALDAVRLRVGALPRHPSNALGYSLTCSVDGVINEYCQPCEAIVDGKPCSRPPLEEREELWLDGIRYEAFNTSGGLGTLCESLAGKVRTLNYRSIRYPGHRDIMRTLLQDLRLGERRELLRDILVKALPATEQDVVVIFVAVSGWKDGAFVEETYANRIHGGTQKGKARTAIQTTTASAACAVLDLLRDGAIPGRGFLRQEEIPLSKFLGTRFGAVFASHPA